MKHIFIRYFKHKDDTIPFDSNPVALFDKLASRRINDYGLGLHIADWMEQYPSGKVDFVLIWSLTDRMSNSVHIQLQENGQYSLTLIGTFTNAVWASKEYNLEIFELGQILGGN